MNKFSQENLIKSKEADVQAQNKRLEEQGLINKAKLRMQKEFIDNPYKLNLNVANRRVVIPSLAALIDKFREPIGQPKDDMIIGKKLPLQEKTSEELDKEFSKLAAKAWPIVAHDPLLEEVYPFLKDETISYALVNSFSDIAKIIEYKGLQFWVMEMHELIAFVPNETLSLLTSDVPASEMEHQKQLEQSKGESTIQSGAS